MGFQPQNIPRLEFPESVRTVVGSLCRNGQILGFGQNPCRVKRAKVNPSRVIVRADCSPRWGHVCQKHSKWGDPGARNNNIHKKSQQITTNHTKSHKINTKNHKKKNSIHNKSQKITKITKNHKQSQKKNPIHKQSQKITSNHKKKNPIHKKSQVITKKKSYSQKITSNHKKKILFTKNHTKSQKKNPIHKKSQKITKSGCDSF